MHLELKLSWETLRNTRNGDIVLTVTNPAPLIVIIAFLRSFLKFRLILVHDVFLENAVATGVLRYKRWCIKLLKGFLIELTVQLISCFNWARHDRNH